ncbi:unnamed protein product [Moneuplotes crassus]|uniref:NAD-dependent epimerase/dehydratase domain-containing protein n=1 Tax=Euplotes crassus TaxID=5936 RepID=A0AAD2CYC3_EUPCR|nr:unnamed protein product [Moneuplotes crassus]
MKVGVTGITGFLGSTVGKHLLLSGKYHVRGSVRSLENASKINPIKQAYKSYEDAYELKEADLLDDDSIYKFVEGLDYVIHVASPFPDISKNVNEEELIKPAVDGTLSVLRASQHFGIKRVVVTASTATISDGAGSKLTYDHTDHVDPETVVNPYIKSKILAENAAWEFVEEAKESGSPLEMSTIHPAGIIGPTLTKGTEFTSMSVFRNFMTGKFPLLPKITIGLSDVRDLADAHEKALFAEPYQRYVTASYALYAKEVSQIIKEEFGDKGLNPTTREMPYLIARAMATFNPVLRGYLGRWGKKITYDCSNAEKHLGYKQRSPRESIIDMTNSFINQGYVKPTT